MKFLEILYVFILGLVEGITEWLPISSTGHLILVEKIFSFMVDTDTVFTESFMEMFDVVVQLGAIIAVVIIFFKKLWPFGFNKIEENNEVSEAPTKFQLIEENNLLDAKGKWILWAKVLVACIPLGIVGVLFNDKIDELFYNPLTISITLIVYGILFILLEWINKKREFKVKDVKELTFRYALIIGFIQVLAVIPGTSRSGVTILGAMLLLCDRTTAAEFSFFLSIPTMFGASLLKIVKYITESSFTSNQVVLLLIGTITALFVSLVVVKGLMSFIKKHGFTGFGIYRIILGIIIIICILCRFMPAF